MKIVIHCKLFNLNRTYFVNEYLESVRYRHALVSNEYMVIEYILTLECHYFYSPTNFVLDSLVQIYKYVSRVEQLCMRYLHHQHKKLISMLLNKKISIGGNKFSLLFLPSTGSNSGTIFEMRLAYINSEITLCFKLFLCHLNATKQLLQFQNDIRVISIQR